MKRLLACLALCASLSASAQDDNCTVLGVQELSSLYSELSGSIDTIVHSLGSLAQWSNSAQLDFDSVLVFDLAYTQYIPASVNEHCTESFEIPEGYYGKVATLAPAGGWRVNQQKTEFGEGQEGAGRVAQEIWLLPGETMSRCVTRSYGGNYFIRARAFVKLYSIDN